MTGIFQHRETDMEAETAAEMTRKPRQTSRWPEKQEASKVTLKQSAVRPPRSTQLREGQRRAVSMQGQSEMPQAART